MRPVGNHDQCRAENEDSNGDYSPSGDFHALRIRQV
jgi:hypothetical protein